MKKGEVRFPIATKKAKEVRPALLKHRLPEPFTRAHPSMVRGERFVVSNGLTLPEGSAGELAFLALTLSSAHAVSAGR